VAKNSTKSNEGMPSYVTASGLKDRGWTDTLIRTFLPTPDRTRVNRHYQSGPPVKLYELGRVEAAEHNSEFKEAAVRAQTRSDRQKGVALKQSNELQERVSNLTIQVESRPLADVRNAAIWHYNSNPHDEIYFNLATTESDPEFLDRISVNYIRHCLTRYDRFLDEIMGKPGVMDAKRIIVEKIFDKIAETYPDLEAECDRQCQFRLSQFDDEEFQN
jgi:hypothetical protein